MENNHNTSVLFASIFLILSIFGLLYISYSILRSPENTETSNSNASSAIVNNQIGIAKFTGEESFKEYLESSNATTNSSYFALSKDSIAPTMAESSLGSGSSPSSSNRYSETNIQVAGVDEADWVKTNGKNIFVSNVFGNVVNYDLPVEKYSLDAMVSPSNVIMNSSTKIFDTLPVDKIKELSEIDFAGNMLLTENLLVVMDYQKIKTYDISNTSEPKKVWDMKLEDSNIVSSRLIGNELVVVFSKYLGTNTPCLIPLYQMTYLEQDTKLTNIPCQNIYYPENQNTNNLITVTRFNTSNGEVKAQTSYLSSQYSSYIYVSLKIFT
jgi:inhibitor of cysteine peptidase